MLNQSEYIKQINQPYNQFKYIKGIKIAKKAIKQYPKSGLLYLKLSYGYKQLKKYTLTLKARKCAVHYSKPSAALDMLLSEAYYKTNHYVLAIYNMKKAVTVTKNPAQRMLCKAYLECMRQNYQKCLNVCHKILRIKYRGKDLSVRTLNLMGCCYYSLGNVPKCIKSFYHVIKLKPTPYYYYNLFLSYYHFNKIYDAIKICKVLIKIDPDNWKNYYNLAYIERDQSRLNEALKHVRQAVRIQPMSNDSFGLLGEILMEMHNYKASVQAYRRSVDLYDQDGYNYGNLGIAEGFLGNFRTAVKDLKRGIKLGPSNTSLFYHYLGQCYQRLNKSYKSILAFKKSIRLGLKCSNAYRGISSDYNRLNLQKAAFKYATKAVSIDPDDPDNLQYLALAQFNLGDCDRAIDNVERAIDITTGNPYRLYCDLAIYYLHYADVDKYTKYYGLAKRWNKPGAIRYVQDIYLNAMPGGNK